MTSSNLLAPPPQVGDPLADWTASSISGSLHKLTLVKLQPDSLYEVEMAAKNCAGLGQPAMMTFRTGKGTSESTSAGPFVRCRCCSLNSSLRSLAGRKGLIDPPKTPSVPSPSLSRKLQPHELRPRCLCRLRPSYETY